MKKIAISEFKALCLELLEQVKRTEQPILITRKGEPIAQVIPPPSVKKPKKWLGGLSSHGKIVGDIIPPASNEEDWEAIKS